MRRRPDHELIGLARDGSTGAVEVLFDRYWPHVWKAAYAVTADRALADDAAQEAIEKGFAALRRFDETRPLGPWLKRIAVNCAVDQLRRRRPVDALPGDDALHSWSLGNDPSDDVRQWAVADAVAALGRGKRLVVVLHFWLDLPIDEIAGVLGVPVGTVASRLARAKAELRAVLEEQRVL